MKEIENKYFSMQQSRSSSWFSKTMHDNQFSKAVIAKNNYNEFNGLKSRYQYRPMI